MKFAIHTFKTLFELNVDSIRLCGNNGVMVILPQHKKYHATLQNSIITVKESATDKKQEFFVYGGIAIVNNNKINVYSDYTKKITDNISIDIKERIKSLKSRQTNNIKDVLGNECDKNEIHYLECLQKILNRGTAK